MEGDAEQTPPLAAAPRHLRRRRFRADVPDPLLVPDVEPYPWSAARKGRRHPGTVSVRLSSYGRKRAAALSLMIIVSLTIPALLLLLILAP